jgi:4'-phosphopantetheinyl transferase superfamily
MGRPSWRCEPSWRCDESWRGDDPLDVTVRVAPLALPEPDGPLIYLLEAGTTDDVDRELPGAARALSAQSGATCASRSYCAPFAVVAVHRHAVGVDIERVSRWEPRQVASILTPAERAWPLPADDLWATSVWASKEALAKALGQPVAYDPRRLGSPLFWPGGRAGRWQACQFPAPAHHVAWLCWEPLPAQEREGSSPSSRWA